MAERKLSVRMRYQISGGRHDGQPWPAAGETLEVPVWEFRDLVRGGHAEPHGQEAREAWKDMETGPEPGRPSKIDPRPPSQIQAEDGVGEPDEAAAKERGDAAAERAAGNDRRRTAQLRSEDRQRAAAYAQDGIMGAPGSEVPGPGDGTEAGEQDRPETEPAAEPSEAGAVAAEGEAGDADQDESAGAAEPAPVPVAPGPAAPKQSWIDYAVSQGATVEEASNMTKADLMSRYGGRL